MRGLSRFTIVTVVAITLWACAETGSNRAGDSASVEGSVAHSIYTKIMERRTDYDDLATNKKVLAACINWQATGKNHVDLRYSYVYYESEFTERTISTSRLMGGAMNGCEIAKKERNLDCDCVAVDRNGSPVLRVPKSVNQEVIEWIEAPNEVGPFDGEWEGVMSCGDCENCVGPMKRDGKITVEKHRFGLEPDTSYYQGKGEIDKAGNIRVYPTPD